MFKTNDFTNSTRFEVITVSKAGFQKRYREHIPTTVEIPELNIRESVYGTVALPFDYDISEEPSGVSAQRNKEFFNYLSTIAKRGGLTKKVKVTEKCPKTNSKIELYKVVDLDCSIPEDRKTLYAAYPKMKFTAAQKKGEGV